jgi:hypothetical protein
MECFMYLLIFYLQLLGIWYREPLASTIELPLGWDILLEWRTLHCTQYLCFEVILLGLENTQINYSIRNSTTRDDDTSTIWSCCESTSSEDEFFDADIFECVVFFGHEESIRKSQTFGMGL